MFEAMFTGVEKVDVPKISLFRTMESGKSIFINDKDLYGFDTANFSLNFIPLLDKSIVEDNLHVISIEQQRFLQRYFEEANKLMEEDLELSKVMKEFDNFLGSYKVRV